MKDTPKDINEALQKWSLMAALLRLAFFVLVVVSIGGSLVVTTFTSELEPLTLKLCSFASALSIGLLTGMDIAGKANRVRQAVRRLTVSRLRYSTQVEYPIDQLISEYQLAERLIGDVNYIPQNSGGPEDGAPAA
jgi:hypothetical protein